MIEELKQYFANTNVEDLDFFLVGTNLCTSTEDFALLTQTESGGTKFHHWSQLLKEIRPHHHCNAAMLAETWPCNSPLVLVSNDVGPILPILYETSTCPS